MALDALWTVDFEVRGGSVNGGVVVLKTGHILGGDSSRYYVGTFKEDGKKLEGQLRIAWYSGARETVWGDDASAIDVRLMGEGGPNTIVGTMSRVGYPEVPFFMVKLVELPS
jgi:hypothetical protein